MTHKYMIHKYTILPMNPEVKTQWCKALESGEYAQTEGMLHDATGYCCLGVLCDLYAKQTGAEWVPGEGDNLEMYGADESLPSKVMAWAGLKNPNPLVNVGGEIESLATLNDEEGMTFPEIAKYIRESL